jgi:hypothetical protein
VISRKTVLVLGAGASMPYGYPSGKALRDDIASGRFDAALSEYFHQVSLDSIHQFSQSFLFSQRNSIDEFLSRRGLEKIKDSVDVTFEQVGKAAISLALRENRKIDFLMHNPLLSEHERKNLKLDFEDHWYQYLWKRLSDDIGYGEPEKLAENEIVIVTFNYDLSLEFYLLEACSATFGIDKKQAAAILSKIQIVHLYGSLSGNPLIEGRSAWPDYGMKLDENKRRMQLSNDIDSIKVMYEARQQAHVEFDDAYQAFEHANTICFFGFGFDPVNVRRLRISDALAKRYTNYKPELGVSSLPRLFATLPFWTEHQRLEAANRVLNSSVSSDYQSAFGHKNGNIDRFKDKSNFKTMALLNETGAF